MKYADFPEIFELARGEAMFVSGRDARPDEVDALEWVAEMAGRNEGFEQVCPVWLGECCSRTDGYAMLTPLACAVNNGLGKTAEALLALGADPGFTFEARGDRGASDVVGLAALAAGYSDTATRAWECAGLVSSALEAKQIGAGLGAPERPAERSRGL